MRQLPEAEQIPVICNFQTNLFSYAQVLFPPLLRHGAVFILDRIQGTLLRHSSVKTI